MADVSISRVTKRFDSVVAVDDVSLTIPSGRIVALLGPSGCGKTTLLRCVAGLEDPTDGEIAIDGRPVFARGYNVPPERRTIGMVFQSYALRPNMTVYRNVAYPLEIRKVPQGERHELVMGSLDLVGLGDFRDRYPGQLSGGQQQRVAVARAITARPSLLLLDEPLSNLDARIREHVRIELRELLTRVGITSIYVTHDQMEAMAVSDRIVVMSAGRVIQEGSAEQLYRRPKDRLVAGFLGVSNFVPVTVVGRPSGTEMVRTATEGGLVIHLQSDNGSEGDRMNSTATLVIRPEDIRIRTDLPEPNGGHNTWRARVRDRIYLGSRTEYRLEVGDVVLRAESLEHTAAAGTDVTVTIDPESIIRLPS